MPRRETAVHGPAWLRDAGRGKRAVSWAKERESFLQIAGSACQHEMSVLQGAAKGTPLALTELTAFFCGLPPRGLLVQLCEDLCNETGLLYIGSSSECCLSFRGESPGPLYISDRQDSSLGNMPLVWIFQVQVF